MLYVNENSGTIRLTRGDTADLEVTADIVVNNEVIGSYEISPTDIVELSIKKNVKDSEYLVHKSVTGSSTITILPEDTKSLPFGKYVYDVQVTNNRGVYTIIEPAVFELLTEVT